MQRIICQHERLGPICLESFDYPETLNAGVELTDKMVEQGFGDNIALIGNGRRRTYKELADWTNRIAYVLVDDLGVRSTNRILIRSANNPAMVACWLAATKREWLLSIPCRCSVRLNSRNMLKSQTSNLRL